MTTSVLVLDAGGPAGWNVARCLDDLGIAIRVHAADASPFHLYRAPAYTHDVIASSSSPAEYLADVRRLCDQYSIDLVWPQNDAEVLLLGLNRHDIPVWLPPQRVLEWCSDKLNTTTVRSIADHDMGATLRRRMWLRPRTGAGSKGALPVESVSEAETWMAWWAREHGPTKWMLSDYIDGPTFGWTSVWQDGYPVAECTRERNEYLMGNLTPHGRSSSPSVSTVVDRIDVRAVAMGAVQMAWDVSGARGQIEGVYSVDIIVDDWEPHVTEINAGRFHTTTWGMCSAGVNLPWAAVMASQGDQPAPEQAQVGYVWTRGVDNGHAGYRNAADLRSRLL